MGLRDILKQAILGAERAFGVSAIEPAPTSTREPTDKAFIPENYHEEPILELTADMVEVDCSRYGLTQVAQRGFTIPFIGGGRANSERLHSGMVEQCQSSASQASEAASGGNATIGNDTCNARNFSHPIGYIGFSKTGILRDVPAKPPNPQIKI